MKREPLLDKSARVGVLGLGYVGLPLAAEFCRKGFRVTGFEVSRARVASLLKGDSYVPDVPSSDLKRFLKAGLFKAEHSFEGLSEQDVIIVCVQTPLRKSKEPDVRNIVSAIREISKRLRRGQLIVLESTTYPGTTDEIVLPLLEESGLRLGRDFYLAFSPERVDPGNPRYGIANTPKIVGGADEESTRLASRLYSRVVGQVVPVSSTRAAELAKLLENSFRSVNIALVNEMAQICRRLGLDVWEVIAAAATKPFGFMPFYPGPGIGGHCIPKDPKLLSWKMKRMNFRPKFIELATRINDSMPGYAVERIAEILRSSGKPLKGARILILGVAYKPDVPDYRESPTLDVIQLLLAAGARVRYHDPFVPAFELGGRRLASVELTARELTRADCAAILTAHRGVDYGEVVRLSRRVFDARNATRGLAAPNLYRL